MNKWRWIFVFGLVALVYFGFGIAQHGQNTGFFVGLVSGGLIIHLFIKARDEAIRNSNMNVNTQNVNVSLHQNTLEGVGFTEEQVLAISNLVQSGQNKKLLVSPQSRHLPEPEEEYDEPLTESEHIAHLLRRKNYRA